MKTQQNVTNGGFWLSPQHDFGEYRNGSICSQKHGSLNSTQGSSFAKSQKPKAFGNYPKYMQNGLNFSRTSAQGAVNAKTVIAGVNRGSGLGSGMYTRRTPEALFIFLGTCALHTCSTFFGDQERSICAAHCVHR